MPFDVKQLPGEPIIISTLLPPFDVENDLRAIGEQTRSILQESPGTYYFITDTTHIDHITLRLVVFGLVAVTRGAASFLLKDERLKPIFVASSSMAKFAAESLTQKQYAGRAFRVFQSLDDALAFCRQESAAQ
jgi:hypothetical protein